MAREFCPECKNILKAFRENGKTILKCDNCGFFEEIENEKEDLVARQKIKQKEEVGRGIVKAKDIFATYDFVCKKCGNTKAQIIDRGIGYSDEDNLILLRCSKCGFSQRNTKKAS